MEIGRHAAKAAPRHGKAKATQGTGNDGQSQAARPSRRPDVSTVILVAIVLLGLALIAYPTVSDWVNSYTQSVAVASYSDAVAQTSQEDLSAYWNDAVQYNADLAASGNQRAFAERYPDRYRQTLDITGSGMMGTVEIPKVDVSLPVYHYATDEVLATATGHMEWSSLPVGGESTHSVISGHRGLPSAVLFSNLDQLQEGDTFSLHILDQVLTYEVDSILIVDPQDTGSLAIEEGKDLCTLVTCTPYGINTQRLLITGHRIANPDDSSVEIAAEAKAVDPFVVAAILAGVTLLVMLVVVLVRTGRRARA